jgi:predicted ATPase
MPKEVVDGVCERTGGMPLFVEEVTRLLLERGEAGGLQAIPPTLQQSLAARLDRLGEAREVARIGAVLGRDFSYALLRAVAALVTTVDDRGPVIGVADSALEAALNRLVDADLLFVEGAPPQATYRFKHALIQDAAYESLLRSRRQALHRRTAEILRDDPERAAAEPEVIAHHFTEAGLDDLAIEWWAKAASRGAPRSAPPKMSQLATARRPITVMFCDLVGLTSLTPKLDAEDWRNLVNAYLDEASAAVTGLGGHVLRRLDDGLISLFGYPQAQQNDAERAVRAALLIQRALSELNARNAGKAPELVARIGLDSGPMVVDATGEVFGEAYDVAARVQDLAEPGSVLVTAAVQRQTAGLFVAEDRGAHARKDAPVPFTLYRVVRASGGGRRSRARALSPLVGRAEELDLLMRRWETARQGEGQLALVVGEPGIGKSRLVEEFRSSVSETPHTFVEWSSSQLLQNTPLHPIAEWGRQRFGADLPGAKRLTELENTLSLIGLDPSEYAPLLAPVVGVPLPEARAPIFAPEELRRRQLAALTEWVLTGARSQAVALAFEDLHWADPTSLDLMTQLAERGSQAPLLILTTTRPDFRPPWSLRSHHSVISLSPLDRADVVLMVGELAARHALSKEVVEGVSERTGGVPMFVEEVARLLLERGEAGGLQAIPPTLQQSLAARLDRLGPAREVAQIGAVLGRDFSFPLLAAVAEVGDPSLQSALDRLVDADLLFVEGSGNRATYRFKHVLIQDAAYESLLKSRRQALHRRAAEILVGQQEPGIAAPEVIAHHFTEAGLDDLAIEWWGKAGNQALRRSAFQEAIAHLSKAIEMADKAGGDAADGADQRGQLQIAYGNALMAARGYGAAETAAAFARARELASGVDNPADRLSTYYGLWAGHLMRGELEAMGEVSSASFELLDRCPELREASMAHRIRGTTYWYQGDFSNARAHLERALAMPAPGRDGDLAFRFSHDVGVSCMAYLAPALWSLGEIRLARELEAAMIARAREAGHVMTVAFAAFYRSMFEIMRLDAREAEPHAAKTLELGRAHGLPFFIGYGNIECGWVRARLGDRNKGVAQMRQGLDSLLQQGSTLIRPFYSALLAELEAEAAEIDAAVGTIDRAVAETERTGQRTFEAETHRLRGEILLKYDPANPVLAEEAILRAIAVAQRQKARSFQLRAALSLVKLRQSTGPPAARASARRLLGDAGNAGDRRGADVDGGLGVGPVWATLSLSLTALYARYPTFTRRSGNSRFPPKAGIPLLARSRLHRPKRPAVHRGRLCPNSDRSLLRNPGLAEAFVHALAAREIDGVVADCLGAEPRDGEARIEFEPGAGGFAPFLHAVKPRQRRTKKEIRSRRIRIELDRPVEPENRFLVAAGAQLGDSNEKRPNACLSVTQADAQRLKDVRLCLLVAASKILRQSDPRVGGGEIPINRQRALALGYALRGAIAGHTQRPKHTMDVGSFRP